MMHYFRRLMCDNGIRLNSVTEYLVSILNKEVANRCQLSSVLTVGLI
jgi:hypothetical protein